VYLQRTDPELGKLLTEVKAAIEAGNSDLGPYECACIRDAHKVDYHGRLPCTDMVCACMQCAPKCDALAHGQSECCQDTAGALPGCVQLAAMYFSQRVARFWSLMCPSIELWLQLMISCCPCCTVSWPNYMVHLLVCLPTFLAGTTGVRIGLDWLESKRILMALVSWACVTHVQCSERLTPPAPHAGLCSHDCHPQRPSPSYGQA